MGSRQWLRAALCAPMLPSNKQMAVRFRKVTVCQNTFQRAWHANRCPGAVGKIRNQHPEAAANKGELFEPPLFNDEA